MCIRDSIGGEEEKSEKEPLRLWGYEDDEKKQIVPAESPVITCQWIRFPVLNGHTAAVFVKFKKNPTKEQLIEALEKFSGCLLYTSKLRRCHTQALDDIKQGAD